MNEGLKSVSVTKFVLGATFAAFVLNFILRILLKLDGMPVTMGIAAGVGALTAMWFANTFKRVPSHQEHTRFLWLYGGTLAIPCIGFMVFASMKTSFNVASFLIVTTHCLAYPMFAHLFMSEKYLAGFLRK